MPQEQSTLSYRQALYLRAAPLVLVSVAFYSRKILRWEVIVLQPPLVIIEPGKDGYQWMMPFSQEVKYLCRLKVAPQQTAYNYSRSSALH